LIVMLGQIIANRDRFRGWGMRLELRNANGTRSVPATQVAGTLRVPSLAALRHPVLEYAPEVS
jgi:hypothetical protein